MLNSVIVMGRITRDIELKKTQTGTNFCRFTVACERDFKAQNGEKQTDFIDVICWRNTADFVSKYFGKGRMAIVQGALQSVKWQDNDGNNRTSWEVNASSVYFGDSKKESDPMNELTAKAVQFEEVQEDGTLPF